MSGDTHAEDGAGKCASLICLFVCFAFVVLPAGKLETVKWAFTWPLSFVLYFTVPNCNKPRWEKWFMVTFASSTLWIAAFSYMMVWMVSPGPQGAGSLQKETQGCGGFSGYKWGAGKSVGSGWRQGRGGKDHQSPLSPSPHGQAATSSQSLRGSADTAPPSGISQHRPSTCGNSPPQRGARAEVLAQ